MPRSGGRPRLSWEPFDPQRLGTKALSRWMTQFYREPPWDEFLKCPTCGGRDDFGPEGMYGLESAEAVKSRRCPRCGERLELFWSPERIEEHLRQLEAKGRLMGFTVRVGEKPAAWFWGHEITPETPAPWGRQLEGLGMYGDRLVVLPEYRNGLVLWYLIFTSLIQLTNGGYRYILARTHLRADNVRVLLQRLGFDEIAPCPLLPERSYWLRVLGGVPAAARPRA